MEYLGKAGNCCLWFNYSAGPSSFEHGTCWLFPGKEEWKQAYFCCSSTPPHVFVVAGRHELFPNFSIINYFQQQYESCVSNGILKPAPACRHNYHCWDVLRIFCFWAPCPTATGHCRDTLCSWALGHWGWIALWLGTSGILSDIMGLGAAWILCFGRQESMAV